MSVKCVCPECGMSITAPAGVGSVACPICDTAVSVPGAAMKARPLAPVRPVAALPRSVVAPEGRVAAAGLGRRRLVLGFLGALAGLWLGGGITALLYFLHHNPPSIPAEPPPQAHAAPSAPVVVVVETQPGVSPPPPPSLPPPPPPPPPALSAEQKKINAAIDKGLAYLQRQARKKPDKPSVFSLWPGVDTGSEALTGLTLLECDSGADDPLVQQLARSVRATGPKLTFTYSLALGILFLDRLGDKSDRPLIQTFALRLVAGQGGVGNWAYMCPLLSTDDEKQLLAFLKAHPGDGTGGRVRIDDFAASLQASAAIRAAAGAAARPDAFDNSNTQFGVLGLWVARRQNIPVQAALVQADRHFRVTQQADGSWKYDNNGSYTPGAMTSAGLLALAMGHGVRAKDDGKPAKDAALEKGFAFLSKYIGPGAKKPFDANAGLGPGTAAALKLDEAALIEGLNEHLNLYYLWSVERVAVVYDLKTIGGKDWYAWAAQVIVKEQNDDGSWKDGTLQPMIGGSVNTCFALLVLKRVNVVPDLTVEVKKAINLKDIEGPAAK